MAGKNTDMASVFGKASGPAEPEAVDLEEDALPELDGPLGEDLDAAEPVPPDFATHALEAFPDLDDTRIDALYRAIKSCAGGM